mgnify:CR=1 FL=1
MNSQITSIANNYADGIVKYSGNDTFKLDKILQDLNLIAEILKNSPDLNEVLKNPAISADKKNEIIDSIFTEPIDVHEKNFLKILIEKGRFNELGGIIQAVQAKSEDIKGEKTVIITSAIPIDSDTQKRITDKLEKRLLKKVIPTLKHNPDIIGGLIIQIEDDVIDMSLRKKLENLSKNITK